MTMVCLCEDFRSSVGSKHVMGVTGAALVGFTLIHMVGNLLVFAGPDALNSYAEKLQGLGLLLWVARGGLFVAAVAHIATGVSLTRKNLAARPVKYAVFSTTLTTPFAHVVASV